MATADGAVDQALRRDAGSVVFGLVEFVLFALFFWWSIHFLLAAENRGGRFAPQQ